MTEQKVKLIVEAMSGITYSEWRKLKQCIDARFSADASAATSELPLADAEKIIKDYSSTI